MGSDDAWPNYLAGQLPEGVIPVTGDREVRKGEKQRKLPKAQALAHQKEGKETEGSTRTREKEKDKVAEPLENCTCQRKRWTQVWDHQRWSRP